VKPKPNQLSATRSKDTDDEASEDGKDERSPYDDDFESASESEASGVGDAKPEPDSEREGDAASEDRKIMSSQAARDHVFPILVSELIKESIVDSKSGARLMELFRSSQGDSVINAALDVYDVDNDMAELVDTLQRVIARDSQ